LNVAFIDRAQSDELKGPVVEPMSPVWSVHDVSGLDPVRKWQQNIGEFKMK
jgi:hypothetical protein